MGSNTISQAIGGVTAVVSDVNQYFTAITGDLLPRNSSGVVTNIMGSLGSTTYKWLKLHVESGYWSIGDVKYFHSYNGLLTASQGWMKCDGRLINEANYNTEHGAGSWASYIGSSAIDGKYLPDMGGRYLTGAASTTQDGSIAFTYTGNAGSQIDIAHTHTQPTHTHAGGNHNHSWYQDNGAGVASSYDTGGSSSNIIDGGASTGIDVAGGSATLGLSYNTNNDSTVTGSGGDDVTGSALSATQTIKPESLETIVYMRII